MAFTIQTFEFYRGQQEEEYGPLDQIFSRHKLHNNRDTSSYLVSVCFV